MHLTQVAEAAYRAYGAVTGFKNHRGDPMPDWHELPSRIQLAWCAAADSARTGVISAELVALDQPPIEVHVHVHCDSGLADIASRLTELTDKVGGLREISMQEVDAIAAVDAKVSTFIADVDTLLQQVAAGIKEISDEGQAALNALTAKVVAANERVGDRDNSDATPAQEPAPGE